MIEMFLKELMLIRQPNQRIAIFVSIDIFLIKGLRFNHVYAIDVSMY